MKKNKPALFLFLCIFILITLLSTCKKKQSDTDYPPLTKEEISGKRLWKRITEETNFRRYPSWPQHEGIHPGQFPHGNYHRIYISPQLLSALPLPEKIVPDGSIIIKVNSDSNKMEKAITIMAKVKGYDPEAMDWFWLKTDLEGNIQAEGKVKGCISCHHLMKKNDYIFVHQLDKVVEE